MVLSTPSIPQMPGKGQAPTPAPGPNPVPSANIKRLGPSSTEGQSPESATSEKPAAAPRLPPTSAADAKSRAVDATVGKVTDKIVGPKPGEEGTAKGAAKEAVGDALKGATEGALTKGGIPGAALGAAKGLAGTFKNNKQFRNAALLALAILLGASPAALGLGTLMIATMASGGVGDTNENGKLMSVSASGLSEGDVSGAEYALEMVGADLPWTVVLAANQIVGNDEEQQLQARAELDDRGPLEFTEEGEAEAPETEVDADGDAVEQVQQAVRQAAAHYRATRSERDKQMSRDVEQVYGWDLWAFSRILMWADPEKNHVDVASGAVSAGPETESVRAIYDPEEGGSEQHFEAHRTAKTLYVTALTESGVSKADAERIFYQSLEWELGSAGCASDATPAGNGPAVETAGGGAWLTPGTEDYNTARRIFELFTQEYGTSGAFAAGVIGNVEQESSFRIDVENSIGAKGLFQFLPASKTAPWTAGGWTIENQVAAVWGLEFSNRAVWQYVQMNAPGTFESLEDWLSTDDPVAASKAFLLGYERPGEHERMQEKRAENALAANELFNNPKVAAQPDKWGLDGALNDPSGTGSGGALDSNCGDDLASAVWLSDGSCGPVNASTGWHWPSDMFTINQGYHLGFALDLGSAQDGAKCVPYDGVVVSSGDTTPLSPWFSGCPAPWHGDNVAVITKHEFRGKTIYSTHSHLRKGSEAPVGARVKAGQQVGAGGMTGCTSGFHAHFGLSTSASGFPNNVEPYQFIPRP